MAETQTGKPTSTEERTQLAHGGENNAVEFLKQDHREVEWLFKDYEKATDKAEKARLAEDICLALKAHTQIEEEIFYPAARDALSDEDIIDEAVVEHAAAKDLINEIEQMEVGEELFDAKVKVLQEQIDHHVKEEEQEMFPKLEKTDMDMRALGPKLADRKKELMTKLKRPNGQRVQ